MNTTEGKNVNATSDNYDARPRHATEPSDSTSDRPVNEPQETSREAPSVNGNVRQKCFICRREIVDNGWFCKLPREARRIMLCCPQCALRYFDTLYPATNGDEQVWSACGQRPNFLVAEEKP